MRRVSAFSRAGVAGYACPISGPVNVRLGRYSIQSNLQLRLQAKK